MLMHRWSCSKLEGSFFVGSFLGIPVFVSKILFLLMFVAFALHPSIGALFVLVFLIVFLHEIAHVSTAKILGYDSSEILIHSLGGTAHIETLKSPWHNFLVSIAGPLTHLIIMPALYVLMPYSPVFLAMFQFNIAMLIFNMSPIFPMDGFYVIKSLINFFNFTEKDAYGIALFISLFVCQYIIIFSINERLWILFALFVLHMMANVSELQKRMW